MSRDRVFADLREIDESLDLDRIRSRPRVTGITPRLITDLPSNTLLYGDDGSRNACPNGPDGFLRVGLTGTMASTMKWGFTLVGTISPNLRLEEAYSFFDVDHLTRATLDFDGRGAVSITDNGATSGARPLLQQPVTGFGARHPGIISFTPTMNAEVELLGTGGIDG